MSASANPQSALEIREFRKNYGKLEAVRGVNLIVEPGELFGLIGPDGAGKTTLMRSICTLLKPTSGTIRVAGLDTLTDVATIRSLLGYMPQRFSLYPDLSVEQNLKFFGEIFRVPAAEWEQRAKQLFRFSRLASFKGRKAGQLSGGMKQKLALSCALIHTPKILVLDEPTFGVDPVSREEFWEILQQIRRDGTTIFVSTAYMDEADLCDRVALMHLGKILESGNPDQVKSQFRFPLYRLTGRDVRALRGYFRQVAGVQATQLFGDSLHISFREEPGEADWKRWQVELGGDLQGWERQAPGIEDVFMESIGENG